MKRILCALLCVLLAVSALPVFAGTQVTEVMAVANCKEYVSLREKPDKSSTRLKKVYLGELVADCSKAENGFIYCEFEGKYGYILEEYLEPTAFTMSDGILGNQQVVKCNEYVSLRKEPNSSSERLAKVPLGAIVTHCVSYYGTFVYCQYKGKTGFIKSEYLTKADYTKPVVTPTPTPAPTPVVYPDILYPMIVVNCEEWVSLRAKPASNSAQLRTIPLGGIVENCVQVNDAYVSCSYEGQYGYVSLKYLELYTEPLQKGFAGLNDLPAFSELCGVGNNALIWTNGTYTVLAQRAYTGDHEEMLAACYSAELKPLWCVGCQSSDFTELNWTNAAVVTGPSGSQLITYVVGFGMTAYKIGDTKAEVEWEITEGDVLGLSGSTVFASDNDGRFYVCGYYDDAPMCIDMEGNVLWKAENDDNDVYWPYKILVFDGCIEVYYDSYHESEEDYVYVLTFMKDGKLLTKQIRKDVSTETLG